MKGIVEETISFFIKREAGDMNVCFITGLFIKNDLKWIRVINTEKLRRNKNINTGAAKWRKKYYDFLNMIIIDYRPINNSDFYKSFLIELMA